PGPRGRLGLPRSACGDGGLLLPCLFRSGGDLIDVLGLRRRGGVRSGPGGVHRFLACPGRSVDLLSVLARGVLVPAHVAGVRFLLVFPHGILSASSQFPRSDATPGGKVPLRLRSATLRDQRRRGAAPRSVPSWTERPRQGRGRKPGCVLPGPSRLPLSPRGTARRRV